MISKAHILFLAKLSDYMFKKGMGKIFIFLLIFFYKSEYSCIRCLRKKLLKSILSFSGILILEKLNLPTAMDFLFYQKQLSQNFSNVFFCQNINIYKGLICFPGQVGPSERR